MRQQCDRCKGDLPDNPVPKQTERPEVYGYVITFGHTTEEEGEGDSDVEYEEVDTTVLCKECLTVFDEWWKGFMEVTK